MTASTRVLTPYDPASFPDELRGGVVAIGNFDGVHRGHAALLRAAVDAAAARGAPAIVLTFDPHPRTFFRPDQPVKRLTTPEARARLFTAIGIDGLVVASFDAAFASVPAEDFIDKVLLGQLGVSGAVVGFNFRFGHRRAGTVDLLAETGKARGFTVNVVEPVAAGSDPVASTDIRALLAGGDVAAANRLFGYRWFVTGEVVHGEKRGRELGFPTANMHLWPDCGLRYGVYAVTLRLDDGTVHGGVASYGQRPTFDNGAPVLETFIFDFDADVYGRNATVSFVDWIRGEERFQSVDELVETMKRDADTAAARLANAPPETELDKALAGLA